MAPLPMARASGPATLRPYDPGDFEALYAIDQVCYARGIAYSRRELRWFLNRPGARCLVAALARHGGQGEEIAGFLIAYSGGSRPGKSGRRGHIITLDVLAEHRRRGIGLALVEEIEREWRGQGVRLVELETATDNQPAIAFWQHCGYRIAGVIPRYYLDRTDAFYMTKALAPTVPPASTLPPDP
jgi:[ribosomal protein S18]-alanine N-acetyltransferase